MTTQPIRLYGAPVLHTPAAPVTQFDAELRSLVADLFHTMHAAPGLGLAAPQIGVGLRVFVYHLDDDEHGHLINPRLTFPSDEQYDGPESCLSIPDLSWDCRRHRHVIADGFDMYGEPITLTGSGPLARCVQHETDHLDGVLFIDRLDPTTRQQALAEIAAADWTGQPAPVVKLNPHPSRR